MAEILRRFLFKYRTTYEQNPVTTLFLTLIIIFFAVFLLVAIFTGGRSIYGMIWYDHDQWFSDYFDSVMYSSDDPYTFWHVIYPPLITVFYAVIGHFIMPFVDVGSGESLSHALRDSQMGIMSYVIILLLTLYAIYVLVSKIQKNHDVRFDIFFFFAILFSYPFIYAMERGNSILIALACSLVFLIGYRSENKWIRLLSYIALGCAVGIKLYPILFGMLILRERKWKEALICGAVCLVLLFLPFAFTDGSFTLMMDNITSLIGRDSYAFGFINIEQFASVLLQGSMSFESIGLIANIVTIALFIISAIIVIFDKDMKFWKILALISCLLILGPGIGSQYLFAYVSIPIVYFLVSEKNMTKNNLFFIICFVAIMALIPGMEFLGDGWSQVTISSAKSLFVMAMTAFILTEGCLNIYHRHECKSSENTPSDF